MRSLAVRAGVVAVLGTSGLLAVRRLAGGGESLGPPRAPASGTLSQGTLSSLRASAASQSRASSGEGKGTRSVVLRLTEEMGKARIQAHHLSLLAGKLRAHWRRMRLPWVKLGPEIVDLVQSIVVRTSEDEIAWVMPTGSGKNWTPSARVWNMSEGSFDQREAILAPTPAYYTFRLVVPPDGRFDFSAATLEGTRSDVRFRVNARTAQRDERVCEISVHAADAGRRWTDQECPLASFAGEEIELTLSTESSDDDASVGIWGTPTILGRASRLPYNVLWVVVDALRPDVLASFHDAATDRAKQEAKTAPLDAWLAPIAELMPVLDHLALSSTRFTQAYSAGSWTRPGTLAMLSGLRSSELGVDTLAWVLPEASTARFYGSDPPLFSLLLRKEGVSTRAFANNFFMGGYANVGIDMGFERLDDHRYRTRDSELITQDAVDWMGKHSDERFFVFCNYNSPHEPREPPARFLERVPPPPIGPSDPVVRKYLAEAAKDDDAIGKLLQSLEKTNLRRSTIVIVTADHGETLSVAHDGKSKLDNMNVRFHHAVSNYEETARIPILLSLPGVLPEGKAVTARVRNIDLVPTLLELEQLPASSRSSGRSLLPLARGEKEAEERPVVTEGRGTKAILVGRHRLLLREGAARITSHEEVERSVTEELYDLESDPGERKNIASIAPEIVAELRARLRAEEQHVPIATSREAGEALPFATVHLRFAGGGAARRIHGTVSVGAGARLVVTPSGLGRDAFRNGVDRSEFAFLTVSDQSVGLDVRVEPSGAALSWQLFFEDQPVPPDRFFAGPFGLLEPGLARGMDSREKRKVARSPRLPIIDARREMGVFVTLEDGAADSSVATDPSGALEMNQMLRDWGYASAGDKKGDSRKH